MKARLDELRALAADYENAAAIAAEKKAARDAAVRAALDDRQHRPERLVDVARAVGRSPGTVLRIVAPEAYGRPA